MAQPFEHGVWMHHTEKALSVCDTSPVSAVHAQAKTSVAT